MLGAKTQELAKRHAHDTSKQRNSNNLQPLQTLNRRPTNTNAHHSSECIAQHTQDSIFFSPTLRPNWRLERERERDKPALPVAAPM